MLSYTYTKLEGAKAFLADTAVAAVTKDKDSYTTTAALEAALDAAGINKSADDLDEVYIVTMEMVFLIQTSSL